MHEGHTSGGVLLGLIAGVAVGVAIGMLLAPRPGRQLRSEIGGRYKSAADRAKGLAGEAREQARTAGRTAAESVHSVIETGRRKAEHIADRAHAGVSAVTPT